MFYENRAMKVLRWIVVATTLASVIMLFHFLRGLAGALS